MTRLVAEPDPAYIRSAVRDSGTNIPLAADKGSGVSIRFELRPPFRVQSRPLCGEGFAVDEVVRRDNQDEVRQAKLARSSRCESGPGKG